MNDNDVHASIPTAEGTTDRVQSLLLLADYLDKGHSVCQSLNLTADSLAPSPTQFSLRSMVDSIKSGTTLSSAMRRHPQLFSPEQIWMIETGEKMKILDVTVRLAMEWARTGPLPTTPHDRTSKS